MSSSNGTMISTNGSHPAYLSAQPSENFWSGRSVAVTGGAGFLGDRTVAQLVELGAETSVIRSVDYDLRHPL